MSKNRLAIVYISMLFVAMMLHFTTVAPPDALEDDWRNSTGGVFLPLSRWSEGFFSGYGYLRLLLVTGLYAFSIPALLLRLFGKNRVSYILTMWLIAYFFYFTTIQYFWFQSHGFHRNPTLVYYQLHRYFDAPFFILVGGSLGILLSFFTSDRAMPRDLIGFILAASGFIISAYINHIGGMISPLQLQREYPILGTVTSGLLLISLISIFSVFCALIINVCADIRSEFRAIP